MDVDGLHAWNTLANLLYLGNSTVTYNFHGQSVAMKLASYHAVTPPPKLSLALKSSTRITCQL